MKGVIWTSPTRRIGKHEWRIVQFEDTAYGLSLTYQWRGPNAHHYYPDDYWHDMEQWPTYNGDNGSTAGCPATLRNLWKDHRATLESNRGHTHAGHTITETRNDHGTRKFTVTQIGETKPRGQTLTLESAKSLAEQFEPSTPTKLGGYERLFSTELTPTGEQTVIPGCERNASPTASQLDLFG